MRKLLFILICLLVFAGCGNPQGNGNVPDDRVESKQDSSDSAINAVVDSMATLKIGIDSLNNQVCSLKSKIDSQEARIGGLKISNWLIIGISALLVVVLIITIWKYAARLSEMEKFIQDFHTLKQKVANLTPKIDQVINQRNNAFRQVTNNLQTIGTNCRNYDIQSQIDRLEKRIRAIEMNAANASPEIIKEPSVNEPPIITTNVYFGNLKIPANGTPFFMDVYASDTGEAKFKVQINGDTATFELLDIMRVKSMENNYKALKIIEGSVSMKEANGFQPVSAGRVHHEKREGYDIWVLDVPAEIKLMK